MERYYEKYMRELKEFFDEVFPGASGMGYLLKVKIDELDEHMKNSEAAAKSREWNKYLNEDSAADKICEYIKGVLHGVLGMGHITEEQMNAVLKKLIIIRFRRDGEKR